MVDSPLPTYEVAISANIMPRDRDEESGKYTDTYSDEDFIEAIQIEEGVAGTSAVADLVGCTHRHALNRLKDLEKQGLVASKDVGRSLVWQISSEK